MVRNSTRRLRKRMRVDKARRRFRKDGACGIVSDVRIANHNRAVSLRFSRALLASALSVLVAACATIHVESFEDPAVDVGGLDSWAWSPDAGKGPFDIEFSDSMYEDAIRDGIAAGLSGNGYTESDTASADFLVSYHAIRRGTEGYAPVNDTSDVPGTWYSQADDQVSTTADSGGSWAAEFDQAELMVDIMLQSEKIMAWRGKATTEIIYTKPNRRQLSRLKKAVRRVMQEFPEKSGGEAR